MDLAVGNIVTGKVTTITKFGAFIALPEGKSGLVHISEVAPTFVSDVHDFLAEGQEVTVKILAITPEGKINLSIKQAMPRPQRPGRREAPARRTAPAPAAPPEPMAYRLWMVWWPSPSGSAKGSSHELRRLAA